jgi:hypothetical protein
MTPKEEIENYVENMLDTESMETFLERHTDMTSLEAIMLMWEHGLIDLDPMELEDGLGDE